MLAAADDDFALCLCQAFISTLLFDPLMSTLPVIMKQNAPRVSTTFRL